MNRESRLLIVEFMFLYRASSLRSRPKDEFGLLSLFVSVLTFSGVVYTLFIVSSIGISLSSAVTAFRSLVILLRFDEICSTLFNVGGKARFTPADLLHVVLLADFASSAGAYLQSDTFHDEYTRLVPADLVPYWQGPGDDDFALTDTSAINITTPSGDDVAADGILCVMFDRDALGVTNLDRRVTTNYNPKAEFYSNWYKFDAGYFNDFNENFVVFFVA